MVAAGLPVHQTLVSVSSMESDHHASTRVAHERYRTVELCDGVLGQLDVRSTDANDHLRDAGSSWSHTIVQWTRAFDSRLIDL